MLFYCCTVWMNVYYKIIHQLMCIVVGGWGEAGVSVHGWGFMTKKNKAVRIPTLPCSVIVRNPSSLQEKGPHFPPITCISIILMSETLQKYARKMYIFEVKNDEDFQGTSLGRNVNKPGMLLFPPIIAQGPWQIYIP